LQYHFQALRVFFNRKIPLHFGGLYKLIYLLLRWQDETLLCPSGIAFPIVAEEIYVNSKDGGLLLFYLMEMG